MVLRPHILQWSGEGPKEGQGRSWWLKMLLGIGRINGLVVGEGTFRLSHAGCLPKQPLFPFFKPLNERVDTLFQKISLSKASPLQ